MDLENITEVAEVYGADKLNQYIGMGWRLLAVASMNTSHEEFSQPIIKYSVGYTGSLPAPHPKTGGRAEL